MKKQIRLITLCSVLLLCAMAAFGQTTTFTYQGRLSDGATAASGTYDLGFALFDAETGGTQIGTAITRSNVSVSGGIFTVQLDFGATAFAAGANRFLQIAIKKTTAADFTTLTPRQQLTSSPYSIRTLSATAADALSENCASCVTNAQINSISGSKITGSVANADNATTATNALTATNAANAANLGNVAAANYLLKNGDGSQLTNLPVRLLPWETVTTAAQTQANHGYIAANDAAQVVFTLPANPAIGDIVRITGAGAGGWRISQNAGQFAGDADFGLTEWTPHENNRIWRSVASSADGTKLVAVVNHGQIYTSTDLGANWTARENNRDWQSVASSADGTKLFAVVNIGRIYISSDSGANWMSRETNRAWFSVASSADGTKAVAVVANGQIYTSPASGAAWTERETNRLWFSVASSADGAKLVAVVVGGQIYTSTDSGTTWTARESSRGWYSVASSADGTKLVAVVNGGQIYTSTNSGASWTARENNRGWQSVASSADGTRLIAVVANGQIYNSTDSGVSWTASESNRDWQSVASSSDGSKLVAVVNSGQIYTAVYGISSIGTAGYLTGGQNATIELQYVGGGKFIALSSRGTISNF